MCRKMTDYSGKKVLAIDTATPMLNLALSFASDRLVKSSESVGTSHGQMLVRKIDSLFTSADIKRNQLDAIVVSTGPGSFTGLRIGLAVAKGMAVALDIPLVGISLFDVATYKYRSVGKRLYIIIPFKRDECFVAPVEGDQWDPSTITTLLIKDLPQFTGDIPVMAVGLDLAKVSQEIRCFESAGRMEYDATDLLQPGLARLSSDDLDDTALLEPMYIQKSQAEIRFDRNKQK